MRLRLSGNADSLLRRQAAVLPDPDTESDVSDALVIVAFHEQRRAIRVEAGVRDGEHETAAGLESPADRVQQRRDAGYIHQRHIAYGGVECAGAERGELLFVAEVDQAI